MMNEKTRWMLSNDIKIISWEANEVSCLRALLQFERQVQSHYLIFPSAEVPVLPYSKNDCVQPSVMKIKHIKDGNMGTYWPQPSSSHNCLGRYCSHCYGITWYRHWGLCFLRLSKLLWRMLPAAMPWFGGKGPTVRVAWTPWAKSRWIRQ